MFLTSDHSNVSDLANDTDISNFFDLENVTSWVKAGGFRCVTVQMADDVISLSLNVISLMRNLLPAVEFDLLADSTLGNCCMDALSALHINADALVHFGHSCLFPLCNANGAFDATTLCRNISVLLVFCRLSFDVAMLTEKYLVPLLASQLETPNHKCLLLYDVNYHSFISTNSQQFPENVFVGRPVINGSKILYGGHECLSNMECPHLHVCRRCFKGCTQDDHSFTVIYVGKRDSAEFTEITMTFLKSANKIVVFDPSSPTNLSESEVSIQLNRALGRRLYFVERVRDAQSVGLVVSASSAADVVTQTAVAHAKQILQNVGKKVYIFCLGRLTPTKLAAYTEVDAFVFLGCPERALQINSSEFYKPVVSFAEMEMACNSSRPMDYRFVPDLTDLLPGGSCFILQSFNEQNGAEISLVSNSVRPVTICDKEVAKDYEESFAGERLSRRQWKGLDPSETAVESVPKNVLHGRKGIPIRYEDEAD